MMQSRRTAINCLSPTCFSGVFCKGTFDGWTCWPDTPAGTHANASCPNFITGFDPKRKYPTRGRRSAGFDVPSPEIVPSQLIPRDGGPAGRKKNFFPLKLERPPRESNSSRAADRLASNLAARKRDILPRHSSDNAVDRALSTSGRRRESH